MSGETIDSGPASRTCELNAKASTSANRTPALARHASTAAFGPCPRACLRRLIHPCSSAPTNCASLKSAAGTSWDHSESPRPFSLRIILDQSHAAAESGGRPT